MPYTFTSQQSPDSIQKKRDFACHGSLVAGEGQTLIFIRIELMWRILLTERELGKRREREKGRERQTERERKSKSFLSLRRIQERESRMGRACLSQRPFAPAYKLHSVVRDIEHGAGQGTA